MEINHSKVTVAFFLFCNDCFYDESENVESMDYPRFLVKFIKKERIEDEDAINLLARRIPTSYSWVDATKREFWAKVKAHAEELGVEYLEQIASGHLE